MSFSQAQLEYMLERGLTLADVIELGRLAPEPTPDPREAKRAADRERMRAKREVSRDSRATVAATVAEPPPSPALSPQTPQTHPHPPGELSTRVEREREDAGFSRFWADYPRKTAKADARKAFSKAWRKLPTGEEAETLCGGLERAKAAWTDAQFIPHAATWLNGERWQDEPSTVIPMRRHDQPHHNNRPTPRQDRLATMLAGAMAAVDEREHGLG